MHGGAMSPAQQYQTSPHSLFFPSPTVGLGLPHSSNNHLASNQNSSYGSFNSSSKAGFPNNNFLSDVSHIHPHRYANLFLYTLAPN